MKQLWLTIAGFGSVIGVANAQISDNVVRIGVLNDQSSVYATGTGLGSVEAAKMAAEDFGGTVNGARIEVISADHQNKPDVGSAVANRWTDTQGVDAIADLGNSAVALAVVEIAKAKNKAALISSAGSTALTGKACSPITVHWTWDSYSLAKATVAPTVKAGGDAWFFLGADYAFGRDLVATAAQFVTASGGKVLGSVFHPISTPDFSSYLLQVPSQAKIVGIANGGDDISNAIKQGHEFGIAKQGRKFAALGASINEVMAIGLDSAQGLLVSEAFYWDLNDRTRAWSERFAPRYNGRLPVMMQAGVYGAVLHYLKAVAKANTDAGKAVVDAMKSIPTEDPLFGAGLVRPDGRTIHEFYQFEVKKPSESTQAPDVYKVVGTVPAEEAFRPLSESDCALIKK
jgi:branched-chain amino acid transport system substrate-binding protein